MSDDVWNDDSIQFPRLIEEAQAAGAFTAPVIATMADSMDLSIEQVCELLERARVKWEAVKEEIPAQDLCPFKVGDRVRWTDPDGDICSGTGKISEVYPDDLYATVEMDQGGETGAFFRELEKLTD